MELHFALLKYIKYVVYGRERREGMDPGFGMFY